MKKNLLKGTLDKLVRDTEKEMKKAPPKQLVKQNKKKEREHD